MAQVTAGVGAVASS